MLMIVLGLEYHLKNHVPLMYELYEVLKDRRARGELSTTLELEIAQGLRSLADPAVQAYFKNLSEQAKARADALNVCLVSRYSFLLLKLTETPASFRLQQVGAAAR
jgi:hypothetical protein